MTIPLGTITKPVCPRCQNICDFLIPHRTASGQRLDYCSPCEDKVYEAKKDSRHFPPLVIRRPKLLEGRLTIKK